MKIIDRCREQNEKLLTNLKAQLPELEKLLNDINSHWGYEDLMYRLYHGSFKVYYAQDHTNKIVSALKTILPDVKLNEMFEQVIAEGTGKKFEHSHNNDWLKHTRPLIEALSHAKYFLEMAVKYGKELEHAPNSLPSGWASFLYLYDMR